MASTFENNLRLEEIGTGEQSGTWGTKTNVNLELITDGLSYSSTGEAIANASTHTITMADGVADEFRSFYLKCTGGGQACTVTLAPNTLSKVWVIENTTSYTLTFSQGSGANVAILAGQVKMIATDGAGSGAAVFDLMQDLAVPDLFVDDDLKLQSDGAVLGFGADNDVTLTHVADTGLLLNSTMAIQFNDASQFINAPSATVLDINATDEIELNATLVDINANLDVSGTITGTGTSVFASLDISGDIDVDGTTNLDAVDIDGAVQIDNTVTVGVDDTGYDVKFFGASASHFLLWDESADELVLAADSKLSFNDAAGGENIVASADGHLEVNAGTTLDVTAPTVQVNASSVFDVNGNIDVSGTYTGGGLMTTGGNIVIPNAGNIGSASDTDAIAIASDGQVTLTQTLTGTAADFSGVATATTFEPDGDTAAGDNAAIGYTAAEGLILTGQGSTNDVTIKNDADADVLEIPTGTTNVTIAGNLGVGGTVTGTGTSVFASLDISGDIDVDGTTNLDVVDIDGAVDMASTLGVAGVVTANAGVVVDNFTLDGTTLALSSGNFLLDVAGDIIFDGDGADILFKDGGTEWLGFNSNGTMAAAGAFTLDVNGDIDLDSNNGIISLEQAGTAYGLLAKSGNNLIVKSIVSDGDLIFRGNDGGSEIDALTLDMADAGKATFNNAVLVSGQILAHQTNKGVFEYNSNVTKIHSYGASSGTGQIQFLTGGGGGSADSLAMTIDNNKNVGLFGGDTAQTIDNYSGYTTLTLSNDTGGIIQFEDDGNAIAEIFNGTDHLGIGTTESGASLRFRVDQATERMRLDNNGNLELHQSKNLHFKHQAAGTIRAGISADSSDNLTFSTGSSDTTRMTLDGSGNATLTNSVGVNGATGFPVLQNAQASNTFPSYSFYGDGNTGMLRAAADTIAFSCAGGEVLRFTTTNAQLEAGIDFITNTASGATNTRIGTNAGDSIVADNAGLNNVLIGANAGTALDSGDTNIAIGVEALEAEDDHANNIAIGYQALHVQDAGRDGYNLAIGYQAGLDTTTGFQNIFIGASAGSQASTADSTVAIGYNAGGGVSANPLTGNENTCVGFSAGKAIEGTTANNTFIGSQAGEATTTGYENVALGYRAMHGNVQGRHNVAIGVQALDVTNPSSAASQYNVAIGAYSGLANSTGVENVFVGGLSARNNTSANYNVMIGYSVGYNATTASSTTFVGNAAGQGVDGNKLTGDNNTAIGQKAGYVLQGAATLNTFVGSSAGAASTTATSNTAVGAFAFDGGTGTDNTAVGAGALGNSSNSGDDNTAVGKDAGNAQASGTENVYVGFKAGATTVDSGNNTALGAYALFADSGGTNTAIGGATLYDTTGFDNTACGYTAGMQISSGHNNLCLGHNAGRSTSPSGAISTGSDTICLGDNDINDLFCADTSISSSDSRDKTDVTNFTGGLDWINALRPVTYKWDKRTWYGDEDSPMGTPDGSKKRDRLHLGFLAQEVLQVEQDNGFADTNDTSLVVRNNLDGNSYGLKYERLVPILVNAIKELSAKVETLETKVAALEG